MPISNLRIVVIAVVINVLALSGGWVGEAHATKYAGEPYHLSVGGRALGRGGAFTASFPDASSAFWNIASLAQIRKSEVILQHAETFGSLLNHDFAAVAIPSKDSSGWSWGAYFTYLGGSGIPLTVIDSITGRPRVDRVAGHSDWSVAVGGARRGGSWWSWGLAVKAVMRNLPGTTDTPSNSAWGLGLDLAWWGFWRQARFGVKIADATTTFLSYDSGRQETIIPHVNWGGEVNLWKTGDGLTTIIAAEAETYFEGRKTGAQFWAGDVSVDLHLGLELAYRNLLFGRLGSDKGNFALGAGFGSGQWAIDAAMTDHEFLDNTYQVSLRYIWR